MGSGLLTNYIAAALRTRRAIGLARAATALAELGLVAGCAGPSPIIHSVLPAERFDAILAVQTAGHAGCPHAEIEIVEYHVVRFEGGLVEPNVAETWTAKCRGATFSCSEDTSGRVACTLMLPPSATAPTATAPTGTPGQSAQP